MGQPWDNVPFERQDQTPWQPGPHDVLAGAVIVMSTVTEVPGMGKQPGLVFRFVDGNNEFMPAVLLLMQDEAFERFVPLITSAVAAAREAAAS